MLSPHMAARWIAPAGGGVKTRIGKAPLSGSVPRGLEEIPPALSIAASIFASIDCRTEPARRHKKPGFYAVSWPGGYHATPSASRALYGLPSGHLTGTKPTALLLCRRPSHKPLIYRCILVSPVGIEPTTY
jgi:hypothetical protein